MDIFIEQIVKHKKNAKDIMAIVGIVLLAILATIAVLMLTISIKALGSFWLIFVVGVWVGAYFLMQNTSIEYEYIMTNNELDIDKIIAKSRRKRIQTIDFKQIIFMAPVDSLKHKREFENTSGIKKILDLSGSKNLPLYFIDFSKDGERIRIIFEPKQEIVNGAMKFNPICIFND